MLAIYLATCLRCSRRTLVILAENFSLLAPRNKGLFRQSIFLYFKPIIDIIYE